MIRHLRIFLGRISPSGMILMVEPLECIDVHVHLGTCTIAPVLFLTKESENGIGAPTVSLRSISSHNFDCLMRCIPFFYTKVSFFAAQKKDKKILLARFRFLKGFLS